MSKEQEKISDIVKESVLVTSNDEMLKKKETVSGFDFSKSLDYDLLLKNYLTFGFQATNFGKAVEIINKMVYWRLSDEKKEKDDDLTDEERSKVKCKIFLGFTSNMISSGMREIIKFLVQFNYVDVIVSTAGGIEEDFIKCLGKTYIGKFNLKGKDLRKQGINRIGNLLVPNDNYCKFEDWILPIFDKMLEEQKKDKIIWTPSKMIARLGKEIDNEDSVYYWAYKNNIPVYSPALTDGSIGDMLYFHTYKNPGLILDIIGDIRAMNNEAVFAKKTGVIILGGGLIKHHIMNANLMRNGCDYCLREDSIVMMYDGTSKKIKDIKVGDKVLTFSDGIKKKRKVLNKIDSGMKKCKEIILLDGRKIICTPNHKLLTLKSIKNSQEANISNDVIVKKKRIIKEDLQFEWKECKDIKISDILICGDIPYKNQTNQDQSSFKPFTILESMEGKKCDFLPLVSNQTEKCSAVARLLGFILTDGNLSHKDGNILQAKLYLGELEDVYDVIDDIKILIPTFKPKKKYEKQGNLQKMYHLNLPSPLPYILNALGAPIGNKKSQKLSFPKWLLNDNLPIYIIREFSSAMLGGDGVLPCITKGAQSLGAGSFHQSVQWKFRNSLNEYLNNFRKVLKKLGFEKLEHYEMAYEKDPKNLFVKNQFVAIKDGKPPKKIKNDGIIMYQGRIKFYSHDSFKFTTHTRYAYSAGKRRKLLKILTYQGVKNYMLTKKNDFMNDYKFQKDNGKTHQDSYDIVTKKYKKLFKFLPILLQIIPSYHDARKKWVNGNKQKNAHLYEVLKVIPKEEIFDIIQLFTLDSFISLPVTEINNQSKKTKVWDISVDQDKNFIANGIVVHNCVYCNTGSEYDGSDSGAKPDEAVSWGKIRLDGESVKIFGEASIIFPLLVAQTFAKDYHSRKNVKKV